MPPIKIIATLKPQKITQPEVGVFVFDFGQSNINPKSLLFLTERADFSGFCVLNVTGAAGTQVILRHAEILQQDGSGNIYTDNLRSAKATDTYILSGNFFKESFQK